MDKQISNNDYSLEKTCRTCACNYNNGDLLPLFSKHKGEKPVNLVEKFHTSKFQICKNDKLPTHICKNCYRNFKILDDFIIQCECSEEILKKIFQETQTFDNISDIDISLELENNANDDIQENCLNNLKIETISNNEYNSDTVIELSFDEFDEHLEESDDILFQPEMFDNNTNSASSIVILNDDDNSQSSRSNYLEKNKFTENESEKELCKICNTSVYSKYYSVHMKTHVPRIFMTCKICNAIVEDIEMHEKTKHKIFICKICDISFPTAKKQRAHVFKMHDRTGYNCSICGRVFLYPNLLKRHLEYVHSKDTPKAICDVCGKMLKNKSVLSNHRATHFKTRKIKDNSDLKHISELNLFKCPLCSFKFRNLYGLKNHSKFHRKDKNSDNYKHICKFCNQRFKRSDHLELHVNVTHLKNLPFTCSFCSKKFPKQYVLNQHIRKLHTDEPRTCEYCNKTYLSRSTLNRHIKLHHSKEKYFKCDICGDVFSTLHKYQTHMKMHTVEEEKETANKIYAEMMLNER